MDRFIQRSVQSAVSQAAPAAPALDPSPAPASPDPSKAVIPSDGGTWWERLKNVFSKWWIPLLLAVALGVGAWWVYKEKGAASPEARAHRPRRPHPPSKRERPARREAAPEPLPPAYQSSAPPPASGQEYGSYADAPLPDAQES